MLLDFISAVFASTMVSLIVCLFFPSLTPRLTKK